jgi:hypothetical protein
MYGVRAWQSHGWCGLRQDDGRRVGDAVPERGERLGGYLASCSLQVPLCSGRGIGVARAPDRSAAVTEVPEGNHEIKFRSSSALRTHRVEPWLLRVWLNFDALLLSTMGTSGIEKEMPRICLAPYRHAH